MFINDISWQKILQSEFDKTYFVELMNAVETEYKDTICFPIKENIFAAFEQCSFNDLKVVIIGQDPYHGQVGERCEANGLCFSVDDDIKIPPSLMNIFKEINIEYDRVFIPTSGNLERWARQGVLLLNATLTVRKDSPNSHKHLQWQTFTDAVIKTISNEKEHIVFLLWGNFAQKKMKFIDETKHLILTNGHPSPMSYNKKCWDRNKKVFTSTNVYLKQNGMQEIEW